MAKRWADKHIEEAVRTVQIEEAVVSLRKHIQASVTSISSEVDAILIELDNCQKLIKQVDACAREYERSRIDVLAAISRLAGSVGNGDARELPQNDRSVLESVEEVRVMQASAHPAYYRPRL
jgi:CRISPR/Cas system-associated endonuclease Cas3-HD